MSGPRGEPAPRACPPPREREADRHTLCARYDGCLDRAIAEGWPGFSCRGCPFDERSAAELAASEPPPREEGEEAEVYPPLAELPPEDLGFAARVRRMVEDNGRAWTASQIARELGCDRPKMVAHELARQANRGAFRRIAPGIYIRHERGDHDD